MKPGTAGTIGLTMLVATALGLTAQGVASRLWPDDEP